MTFTVREITVKFHLNIGQEIYWLILFIKIWGVLKGFGWWWVFFFCVGFLIDTEDKFLIKLPLDLIDYVVHISHKYIHVVNSIYYLIGCAK